MNDNDDAMSIIAYVQYNTKYAYSYIFTCARKSAREGDVIFPGHLYNIYMLQSSMWN